MIALDPFKQLNSEVFELVAPDAIEDVVTGSQQIPVKEIVRYGTHRQFGGVALFQKKAVIPDQGNCRV